MTQLNAAGSAQVFSTYFGGGLSDSGSGIAVDTSEMLRDGFTNSTDFLR